MVRRAGLELLPVELGLLARSAPDAGAAGVVDGRREGHPAVVVDAGQVPGQRLRDVLERVVIVVEHDDVARLVVSRSRSREGPGEA